MQKKSIPSTRDAILFHALGMTVSVHVHVPKYVRATTAERDQPCDGIHTYFEIATDKVSTQHNYTYRTTCIEKTKQSSCKTEHH
jgi:hypothetical protein